MAENKTSGRTLQLPLLALRGLVVFEQAVMHFDVKRPKSILAIKAAMDADRQIFIVTQSDIEQEDPTLKDLYTTGVICRIRQLLKADNDTVRVLIEGVAKARLAGLVTQEPFFVAEARPVRQNGRYKLPEDELAALLRLVKRQFRDYCESLPNAPKDLVTRALGQNTAADLFREVAPNLMIPFEDKQALLECPHPDLAMQMLAELLERECKLLHIEHEIYDKVKERMDKNQRDYFLREQQRVIAEELGEGDNPMEEAEVFYSRIEAIRNIGDEAREHLYKECDRLARMPFQSQEASVIRSYLEACLDLPFDRFEKDILDIPKAERQLNADHYGLQKVKERILELLSVRKLKPDVKGQIICLVGPPGVGKTSVAASIAKALHRKYVRISLGGLNDESEIRGHRKTYLGSMPGRVIQAFRQAKCANPLILLDEIDKLSNDFRGDPASALLEVLDAEQNHTFVDRYIEIPFDLSHALFVTTANNAANIPGPLRDRMELIELSSYTREEKFEIAKRHLIKKQIVANGLNPKQLRLSAATVYEIIDCYTREAGVRTLERRLATLCRKAAKRIVSGEGNSLSVTPQNIEEFLGVRRYKKNQDSSKDLVGTVNGLAWTEVGGELLQIECSVLEGTGKVKLTGSLGDVMKESADIAISYVRSIAAEYGIKPDFYKNCDLHIHAPEGAVPKDGPSAGVTMVTALVSALTGLPVKGKVAMTGEISLLGRVMPIGGLKEKAMAAYREHKRTVVIPRDNLPDLKDIDPVVLEHIQFIPAEQVRDVLKVALIRSEEPAKLLSQWCVEQAQSTPVSLPVRS